MALRIPDTRLGDLGKPNSADILSRARFVTIRRILVSEIKISNWFLAIMYSDKQFVWYLSAPDTIIAAIWPPNPSHPAFAFLPLD